MLEQKQRQRLQSSTNSRPGSANVPMPQLSQLSQLSPLSQVGSDQLEPEVSEMPLETPRVHESPEDSRIADGDPETEMSPPEPEEESREKINGTVTGDSQENDEAAEEHPKDGRENCEAKEPANRLPKPTEVSQCADAKATARAKSASKSSVPGTSKPKRTRSAEKPQKFVLAQPARYRLPQRVPTSPETRDIASSPMSPNSPTPGNALQSESLNGLFRELGILREDFIAAKLDSERARERVQELESENSQLKKQLQEAEKVNRKLLQQKQEIEHSGDLWRQRWEDSQQQLEECWKRFDALKVVQEVKQAKEAKETKKARGAEQPEGQNTETFSQSSLVSAEPSPSGGCQVELSSPTHELPMPFAECREDREVQDPPVAEITSEDSRAQPKSATGAIGAIGAIGASGACQVAGITGPCTIHGFQTPPVTGFPLSALSPRTLPARTTFPISTIPSPRTQQALRVVSVPTATSSVYYSSQVPQAWLKNQIAPKL